MIILTKWDSKLFATNINENVNININNKYNADVNIKTNTRKYKE